MSGFLYLPQLFIQSNNHKSSSTQTRKCCSDCRSTSSSRRSRLENPIYTYIYILSILYLYLKVSKIIFISPGFTGSGVAGGSLAAAAQVSPCLG